MFSVLAVWNSIVVSVGYSPRLTERFGSRCDLKQTNKVRIQNVRFYAHIITPTPTPKKYVRVFVKKKNQHSTGDWRDLWLNPQMSYVPFILSGRRRRHPRLSGRAKSRVWISHDPVTEQSSTKREPGAWRRRNQSFCVQTTRITTITTVGYQFAVSVLSGGINGKISGCRGPTFWFW